MKGRRSGSYLIITSEKGWMLKFRHCDEKEREGFFSPLFISLEEKQALGRHTSNRKMSFERKGREMEVWIVKQASLVITSLCLWTCKTDLFHCL